VRRAQFLNESVADLRRSLRQRGTDLAVRVGRPEDILPGLCKAANVHTVFAFEDCYHEEKAIESATAKALNQAGVAMRVCWGGTLIHRDDLPFNVARELPGTFTNFRTKVERSWTIRSSRDNTIPSAPVRRPYPVQIEPQELPSLSALGYSDAESIAVDRRAACVFVGGESAALARVNEYIWTRDLLKSYKETRNGMLGADYSSKFSPWLAHGCLSPLLVYEEVQRYEAQRVKNESTYWCDLCISSLLYKSRSHFVACIGRLIFELLFRDFFRLYAVHFGAKVFFRLGTSGTALVIHHVSCAC
jgi:deoxyribodipyrimidine photo-lyase